MQSSRRPLVIALALLLTAGLLVAKQLERKTYMEPVDGIEEAEVTFEMGLCEMDLMPGKKEDLIHVDAMYDPEYFIPDFRVERQGSKAYVYLNPRSEKDQKKNIDSDEHYYEIKLSPSVKLNLNFEIGLGEHDLDLDGLQVERIRMESGLAETRVRLKEPNPIRAKSVTIETGLGEFHGEGIGYLRFDRLELENGLGEATVDFTGYEGNGEAKLSVGLGDVEVILPKGLGVRVFYDDGLFSSVDMEGLKSVGRDLWESDNYDTAEHKLTLDLEVGMGSMDIYWR
jgi:hypothetical protein